MTLTLGDDGMSQRVVEKRREPEKGEKDRLVFEEIIWAPERQRETVGRREEGASLKGQRGQEKRGAQPDETLLAARVGGR